MLHWSGSLTGIQRVVYNYAERYALGGASFFAYNKYQGRFIEIPFEKIRRTEGEAPQQLAKRQVVKKRLSASYKRLPKTLRAVSSPAARISLQAFRKVASQLLDGKGAHNPLLRALPPAHFSSNDTVVVFGAGWNERDFAEKLAEKKQELGFKVVHHINDILPITNAHLFAKELTVSFPKYVDVILQCADLLTVISEATKNEIITYCKKTGFKTPEIKVVRLGEDIVSEKSRKPDNDRIADKYIFALGTFEIRKNYILLYQAVKLAQEAKIQIPQIVIVGRKGWLTSDLQYVLDHDTTVYDNIVHLSSTSDSELKWLFENSMFSIFPSLCEGWGLPIAESLQSGKFCLSSGLSSMPEIAGDQIDYFSPYDPADCLRKIVEYVDGDKYLEKNRLIASMYVPYSWDASFTALQKIVSKV